MAYFPLFVDLKDKKVLIIGGGTLARRKAEKLIPYEPVIYIASEEFCDELKNNLKVHLIYSTYEHSLLTGKDYVICATNDSLTNRLASMEAQKMHIPVNVVDDKEESTFIFPALIHQKDLTIGISTEGASPSAAVYLKEKIEKTIPDSFSRTLEFLQNTRHVVLETLPDEKQRADFFKELFNQCLENDGPLSLEQFSALLQKEAESSNAG